MTSKAYPSDLNDEQWKRIQPFIPAPKAGGRPRTVNMRDIFNGILYLLRSGCSWRMLPNDFPPWGTVHYYYRKFRRAGIWQKIHNALRKEVRKQAGRKSSPSAAIIDSQSVKTTEKGGFAVMMPERKSRDENAILW